MRKHRHIAANEPGRSPRSELLAGSALALLDVKDRRGRGPAPLLLLASLCVALLAVAGYVYSVFGFYGVSRFTPMALNTALALTVLCAGGLCARPDAWPVAGVLRAWCIPHSGHRSGVARGRRRSGCS